MDETESTCGENMANLDFLVEYPIFDYVELHSIIISAVLKNDLDGVKDLVASGFSINTKSNQGNTPLHLAVLHDYRELFDFALTVGNVQIDAKNHMLMTPLMCAVKSGLTYFAECLLEKGASPNECDIEKRTILHEITSIELAVLLMEEDIEIDAVDCDGKTPLYVACERGDYEMASLFLCHGADPSIKSSNKRPYAVAVLTCPLFFHEIIFDHTFHENEKVVTHFDSLIKAVANPPLLEKFLRISSDVVLGNNNLATLASMLDVIPAEIIKKIDNHFVNLNLRETLSSLVLFEGKYAVLKNPDVLDYFDFFCASTVFINSFSFSDLFSANSFYLGQSILVGDTLNNLVYILLSHGCKLEWAELEIIYNKQKFSDLFETLLHMQFNAFSGEIRNTYVNLVYNIECNPRKIYRALRLPIKSGSSVFTLLELSANVARRYLVKRYNLKTCGHLISVIKQLGLSTIFKDILIYKLIL